MGNNTTNDTLSWGGGTDEYGNEIPHDLDTLSNYIVEEVDSEHIQGGFERLKNLLTYTRNEDLLNLAQRLHDEYTVVHDDDLTYYVTSNYVIPENYGMPIPDKLSDREILEETYPGTNTQRNRYYRELNDYFSTVEDHLDERNLNYKPFTQDSYPIIIPSKNLDEL